MRNGNFKKKFAVLVLTSFIIILSACNTEDGTLPDWRVRPTIGIEWALAQVMHVMDEPEESFLDIGLFEGFTNEQMLLDRVTLGGRLVPCFQIMTKAFIFYEPIDFYVAQSGYVYFGYDGNVKDGIQIIRERSEGTFTKYDESLFSPTFTIDEAREHLAEKAHNNYYPLFNYIDAPSFGLPGSDKVPPFLTIYYDDEIIEGYSFYLVLDSRDGLPPRFHLSFDGSIYEFMVDDSGVYWWEKIYGDGVEAPVFAPPVVAPPDSSILFSGETLSGDTYEMPVAAGWTVEVFDGITMAFSPDGGTSVNIFAEPLSDGVSAAEFLGGFIQDTRIIAGVDVTVIDDVLLGGEAGVMMNYITDGGMEITQQINIKNRVAHLITITLTNRDYEDDIVAMADAFRFK
jgi:hypothetical protein